MAFDKFNKLYNVTFNAIIFKWKQFRIKLTLAETEVHVSELVKNLCFLIKVREVAVQTRVMTKKTLL